jgi:hypothetical protein
MNADFVGITENSRNSSRALADFIAVTNGRLESLKNLLEERKLNEFYFALPEFRYLAEYSNDLSRYWYLMRGYSGALSKLAYDKNVKGAKKLYTYYFEKYGDRRIIRKEHWFEKKRWEFLDDMQDVFNEYELEIFFRKYTMALDETFKTYSSFLKRFINDLRRLENSAVEAKEDSRKNLPQTSSEC